MGERRGVYLEDSNIDGRIILKLIFRKWNVRRGLELAQDRYWWWALLNMVMNNQVP
jgi:hypothetical protein